MEIEKKYRLDKEYFFFLEEKLGSRFTYVQQIDYYYIVNKNIQGNQSYLRLRNDLTSKSYHIELKQSMVEYVSFEQTVTIPSISEFETMKNILSIIGLSLKCIIEKNRKIYQLKDNISIMLDEVKEIGFFIEIEIEGKQHDLKKIDNLASMLGLDNKNIISGYGYPDLAIQQI